MRFPSKKILLLSIIGLFLATNFVLAQNIGFGTLDTVAGGAGVKTIQDAGLTDIIVGEIIAWVLGFVGVLFLGLVIYSGFQWMSAGGNEDKVNESKKRIISSVVGLALVFFAFIISNVIFKFFYEQTGRGAPGETTQAGREKIACEFNSDCPANKPICVGVEITGKWCTCTKNADCTDQSIPFCFQPALGTNFCGECDKDVDCNDENEKCKEGRCIKTN